MTLIELLLALMVLAIVLTGVTTLAFALGSARDSSDDTGRKQAHLRFAMGQLADLLRQSRLVYYTSDSEVVLWTCDTDADGSIDVAELVSLRVGSDGTQVVMTSFMSPVDTAVSLSAVADYSSNWWYACGATPSQVIAIPECTNARFYVDQDAPYTRHISLSFDLMMNGQSVDYTISGNLRAGVAQTCDPNSGILADDD